MSPALFYILDKARRATLSVSFCDMLSGVTGQARYYISLQPVGGAIQAASSHLVPRLVHMPVVLLACSREYQVLWVILGPCPFRRRLVRNEACVSRVLALLSDHEGVVNELTTNILPDLDAPEGHSGASAIPTPIDGDSSELGYRYKDIQADWSLGNGKCKSEYIGLYDLGPDR